MKYICKTKELEGFTKGVVYEFKNEAIFDDNGQAISVTRIGGVYFKKVPETLTFKSKAELAKALIKYKELWLGERNRLFYDESVRNELFWCELSDGSEEPIRAFWERYDDTFYTSNPIEEKKYPSPDNHKLVSVGGLLTPEMVAFVKLITWRNLWWEVDGWKPDWGDGVIKFSITAFGHKIDTNVALQTVRPLVFETGRIRDSFLKTFKDLIEECRGLI